jgi:hypothetical protein
MTLSMEANMFLISSSWNKVVKQQISGTDATTQVRCGWQTDRSRYVFIYSYYDCAGLVKTKVWLNQFIRSSADRNLRFLGNHQHDIKSYVRLGKTASEMHAIDIVTKVRISRMQLQNFSLNLSLLSFVVYVVAVVVIVIVVVVAAAAAVVVVVHSLCYYSVVFTFLRAWGSSGNK